MLSTSFTTSPELYELWRAVNHLLAVRRRQVAARRLQASFPLTLMLWQQEHSGWLSKTDPLAEAEHRVHYHAQAVLSDWPR